MDQQKEGAPSKAKQDEPEPPHVMSEEAWKRIKAQLAEPQK